MNYVNICDTQLELYLMEKSQSSMHMREVFDSRIEKKNKNINLKKIEENK